MNELKKIVQDMRVIVGLDLPSHCHGLQHGIQEFADRLEALSQTHVLVPTDDFDRFNTLLSSIQPCTDGGCVVEKPKGMHTNAGCRCVKTGFKCERVMRAAYDFRSTLLKEVSSD